MPARHGGTGPVLAGQGLSRLVYEYAPVNYFGDCLVRVRVGQVRVESYQFLRLDAEATADIVVEGAAWLSSSGKSAALQAPPEGPSFQAGQGSGSSQLPSVFRSHSISSSASLVHLGARPH